MRRPAVTAALACLAACAALPAAAQKVMTPGAWEMTSTITREIEGQALEQMGRHTIQMCLTRDFLAADPYFTPNLDEQRLTARQAKCTTADHQRTDDAASWAMACELADGSRTQARVRNTAGAERMTTQLVQDVERGGGGKGRITMAGEGRYIGECTEEMSKPEPPKPAKKP